MTPAPFSPRPVFFRPHPLVTAWLQRLAPSPVDSSSRSANGRVHCTGCCLACLGFSEIAFSATTIGLLLSFGGRNDYIRFDEYMYSTARWYIAPVSIELTAYTYH